jgi:hypothetical protein
VSWVATSRKPVTSAKDLDEVKPPDGLTSLSKPERKQYDAAKKAAGQLVGTLHGEVNVALSGHADEHAANQVQIVVAEVE